MSEGGPNGRLIPRMDATRYFARPIDGAIIDNRLAAIISDDRRGYRDRVSSRRTAGS